MSDLDRVLFDVPGPRARARARVATVVVGLVVAAVVALAVVQFGRSGQLDRDQWLPFRVRQIWTTFLLPGLGASLLVTLIATVFAVPLGALVALGRLSRTAPVRWLSRGYIEVFRSLPVLLLLYVFQLGLPILGIVLPVFWQLAIPIVISAVAYLAALVGAGVQSLDRGQSEAAMSIGLRYWPMMRVVVLPQVVRRLLPALITEVVAIFIATTLGYAVSYTELLHNAQVVGQFYQVPVQAYLVVAVVYVVINATLSRVATVLQRRQAGGRASATVGPRAGLR